MAQWSKAASPPDFHHTLYKDNPEGQGTLSPFPAAISLPRSRVVAVLARRFPTNLDLMILTIHVHSYFPRSRSCDLRRVRASRFSERSLWGSRPIQFEQPPHRDESCVLRQDPISTEVLQQKHHCWTWTYRILANRVGTVTSCFKLLKVVLISDLKCNCVLSFSISDQRFWFECVL